MTDSTGTPSALTDQQIIERIATEVMGWEINSEKMHKVLMNRWNPLTDWNHWREVEEKVIEDEDLFSAYLDRIPIADLVRSDLPTRAKALFLSLQ